MNAFRIGLHGISGVAVAILAACSTQQTSKQPAPLLPTQTPVAPMGVQTYQRTKETPDKIIADFARLESTLAAVNNGNDTAASQFLATQSQSDMGEKVRNAWLKSLGQRNQVALFQQQYALLPTDGRDQEVRCYAHAFGIENQADFVQAALEETGKTSAGCAIMLQNKASSLHPSRAWRRVRSLIAADQITHANNLAVALGSPLNSATGFGAQETALRSVISPAAQKSPETAAARLQQIAPTLNSEQVGFAWGVLGLVQAKRQNFAQALQYYRQADRNQLSTEQFEWFARSALRQQNWAELAQIIASMPAKLQNDPTWLYWRGRSLAATGNQTQAASLYQQAARSGRNFYAVLASEELGQRINTQNNVVAADANQVNQLNQDGAIHRALSLYYTSKQQNNWKMRRQAQNEWRYATRGMNEATLLTAAQVAFNHQFYEMAINSAERTDQLLNYQLRYITPFRDLVTRYSQQHSVDAAWVYGLIRQESRFVMGAQSSVGAQGLMQVMPATAQEIARKIGMSSSELYSMEGNIRMGTWYMADARRSLKNNDVLATAGYNAGPGRARQWQGSAMEGAIYAETIPFNETRDYVKKVMTNAVYYASLLGERQTSLKQRMGVVPAK